MQQQNIEAGEVYNIKNTFFTPTQPTPESKVYISKFNTAMQVPVKERADSGTVKLSFMKMNKFIKNKNRKG